MHIPCTLELRSSVFKSKLCKYLQEGSLRLAIGAVAGFCDAFPAAFTSFGRRLNFWIHWWSRVCPGGGGRDNMDRRTRDRSRWTRCVGGKSFLQEVNNHFERAHCIHIGVKRPVKHFHPMRGVHITAAHFIQQLIAIFVQNINIFFLRHVNQGRDAHAFAIRIIWRARSIWHED